MRVEIRSSQVAAGAEVEDPDLAEPQRVGDRAGHVLGLPHRRQLDHPDAAGELAGQRRAASVASRVLPAPPGPTRVTQPVLADQAK